jgi:acyl carrier protein
LSQLPEYMVPAAYVQLEQLPLTPNGKLDRKALPAPESDAYNNREYEAPLGKIEQAVAVIWQEVLKVEQIGRHDNFFELGGHSLLAVQVVSRIRQTLEVEIALRDVFEVTTLAMISEKIVDLKLSEFDSDELEKVAQEMQRQ